MTAASSSSTAASPKQNAPRAVALHMARVILFAAILLLIRQRHIAFRAEQALASASAIPQQRLQAFYPDTPRTGEWDVRHGAQTVTGADGTTLGFVVQTAPESDPVIGYLGPTNVLIAFDDRYHVIGIDLLESGDTAEHVAKVTQDRRFMNAYRGLSWQEAARRHDVDAVSGATLTSLAVVESISHRLGNPCPSLRFPVEMTVGEIKEFLPDAVTIFPRAEQPLLRDVFNATGQRIGALLRTSPTCDGLAGYQGPTDTLIVLDTSDKVARIAIRSSYDNQPYVRYVREDEYFCTLFNGLPLEKLARLDLVHPEREAAEVEGVSGATITSMAVARSLIPTAAAALKRHKPAKTWRFSLHDLGTGILLFGALLMTFTHLRGRPRPRFAFRVVLVLYLGFLSGDMLSQALLVGWAQNGVPWRLAPGLVVLVGAALFVPILTKRQMYCHHLCPFGAAQQLLRHRPTRRHSPRRRPTRRHPTPRWLKRTLALITPALLVVVVVTAMRHLPLNLAGIEPFNAFCLWLAGTATLAVAAAGMTASAVIPMAYCRYGCPTGAMLGYLRLNARSDRLTRRDLFALGLFAVALLL